jgi:hypothetical protein
MFKLANKELIFKLNYEPKSFFLQHLKEIENLLPNDNVDVFVYEEEDKIKAFFLITKLDNKTFHLSYYLISPTFQNEEVIELVINFVDFAINYYSKKGFKTIIVGVDYYNDELLEKYVEKGFSILSYKLKKDI